MGKGYKTCKHSFCRTKAEENEFFCKNHLVELSAQKLDIKKRDCLSCGAKFKSEWAGHRVCKNCKNTRAWRDGQLNDGKLSFKTVHKLPG